MIVGASGTIPKASASRTRFCFLFCPIQIAESFHWACKRRCFRLEFTVSVFVLLLPSQLPDLHRQRRNSCKLRKWLKHTREAGLRLKSAWGKGQRVLPWPRMAFRGSWVRVPSAPPLFLPITQAKAARLNHGHDIYFEGLVRFGG